MKGLFAALTFLSFSTRSIVAFKSTRPILAWSSNPDISPSPSNIPQTDLCSLSSLLLISIPSLHYSDLPLLPPSIRSSFLNAHPNAKYARAYVPNAERDTDEHVQRVVRGFEDCGGRVEGTGVGAGGSGGKVLRVERVEELRGVKGSRDRALVLQDLEQHFTDSLSSLPSPHLILLTSPSPHLSPSSPSTLRKRQEAPFASSDSSSESLADWEGPEDFPTAIDGAIYLAPSPSPSGGDNSTLPGKDAPLFEKYTFVSPGLLLGVIVVLFVIIPLLGIVMSALVAIEVPQGLKEEGGMGKGGGGGGGGGGGEKKE